MQAQDIGKLGQASPGRAPVEPRQAVERVLGEQGLRAAVTSLDAADGRVRLTFAAVRFDALLAMLDAARPIGQPSADRNGAHAACGTGHGAGRTRVVALRRSSFKRTGVAVAAVLALAAALAAFAPAALLNTYLQQETNGALRLAATTGTIWRGQGQLGDAAGTWAVPLGWDVAPLALLRGELEFALIPPSGVDSPRGRVRLHGETVELQDTVVVIPARALQPLFARVPGLSLQGDITATANQFTWLPKSAAGRIVANWRNANLKAMGISAALGEVTIDASSTTPGAADGLLARVQNAGGDLRVAGDLRLTGGPLAGDLTLQPTATASTDLQRALRLLGAPDASGAVRVRFPVARSGRPVRAEGAPSANAHAPTKQRPAPPVKAACPPSMRCAASRCCS